MSKIEWTEESWNPVVGCTKCSPGCLNCYAEKIAHRLAYNLNTPQYLGATYPDGKWTGEIECCEWLLDKPLHWPKPRKIFVCSMSDLFHPKMPFEFIDKVLDVTQDAPQHIYQILTKRPDIMLKYYKSLSRHSFWDCCISGHKHRNLHLGVTVCNQAEADEKTPILLQIPAAVRFVSIEPMLGNMWLGNYLGVSETIVPNQFYGATEYSKSIGKMWSLPGLKEVPPELDWVIVGAEKIGSRGVGRECKIEWVQSIVDQCKAANVPAFVKQIHKDGKLIKMPEEFPQEYPKCST